MSNYPEISGSGDLYSDRMMRRVFDIYRHKRAMRPIMWGDETCRAKILALRGHEGTLYVTWDQKPSKQEVVMIAEAWADAETGPTYHQWPTMEPEDGYDLTEEVSA